MPLVVQFLLLVGAARDHGRPVRAEGPLGIPRVRTGLSQRPPSPARRDAMIVLVVLPTTVMALLQGLFFWPIGTQSRTPRSSSWWDACSPSC